jgi:hypothetical protein
MSMSANEWWEEYDRRERKKAARQIIRWVNDPVGAPLPDDEDVWAEAERESG